MSAVSGASGGLDIGGTLQGVGSLIQAGTGIYNAYWGVKQGKEALRQSAKQLELMEKQQNIENERYNARESERLKAAESFRQSGQDFKQGLDETLPMNRI